MAVRIDISEKKDIVILKITGKVDSFSVDDLKNGFSRIMKKGKTNILVNMKDLNYIDSRGIGSIVSFAKWVDTIGGEMKIAEMGSNIRQVFNLLSFDQLFSIYETETDALSSFQASVQSSTS